MSFLAKAVGFIRMKRPRNNAFLAAQWAAAQLGYTTV
jgi:hypothetical protein